MIGPADRHTRTHTEFVLYRYRLAGYPASLGTLPLPHPPIRPSLLPPSLGLPGFGQNICSAIAQNNLIPEIHLKK